MNYMGVFLTPEVVEMETGPYTFVYEEFVGPYKSGYGLDSIRINRSGVAGTR